MSQLLQYKLDYYGLYFDTKPKIKTTKSWRSAPESLDPDPHDPYRDFIPFGIMSCYENDQRPTTLPKDWSSRSGYPLMYTPTPLHALHAYSDAYSNDLRKIVMVELSRETIDHPKIKNVLKKELVYVLATNPYSLDPQAPQMKQYWVEANWVMPLMTEKEEASAVLRRLQEKWSKS